ncbi:hypothetical protein BJ508DRAFT_305088 [Ascobolus immersus RN42]|uniref:Uncharacterized protein n=1 Tax=Ascobolus immersus RN42 TaxID=1160509 RepID=A0A3N4IAG3_ASCIM|nr:hypothetical protein BJ508DRAFT_305088 [Ascobolus immersus RN42]
MSVASLATVSQPKRPHRSHSGASHPSFDIQRSQSPTPSSSRPSSVTGRPATDFQEIALRPAPVPVYTGRLKNRAASNIVIPVYPGAHPRPTPPPRSYSGSHGFRNSKSRLHDEAQFISGSGRYTGDNPRYDEAISKLLTKRSARTQPQSVPGAIFRPRHSSPTHAASSKSPPIQHQHPHQHHQHHQPHQHHQHHPRRRIRDSDPPKTSSSVSVEEYEQEERPASVPPQQVPLDRHRSQSNISQDSEQQDISVLYALAGAFLAANPASEEMPIKKHNRVVQPLNESWEELSRVKPDTPAPSEVGSSRTRADSTEETRPEVTVLRRTFSVPPVDIRSASNRHLKRSKSIGPRNGSGPTRKENRSHAGYPHKRKSSPYGPHYSESRRPPAKGILRHPVASSKRFGTRARFDEGHLLQNTVNSRPRKIMRDLEPDEIRSVQKAKLAGHPMELRQRAHRSNADPVASPWAQAREEDARRAYYRPEEVNDARRAHYRPEEVEDARRAYYRPEEVEDELPSYSQGVDGHYEDYTEYEALQDEQEDIPQQPLTPLEESSPIPVDSMVEDDEDASFIDESVATEHQTMIEQALENDKDVSQSLSDNEAADDSLIAPEEKPTVIQEGHALSEVGTIQTPPTPPASNPTQVATIEEQPEKIHDAVIVLKEKMNTTKHREAKVPPFASGKPLFNLLPISFYDPQVAQPSSSPPCGARSGNIWRRARVYLCMGRKRQVDALDELDAQQSSQSNISSGKGSPTGNPSTPAASSESTISQVRAALEDSCEGDLSDDLVDFEDLSYAPEIGVGSLRLTEREGYFEPEKRLSSLSEPIYKQGRDIGSKFRSGRDRIGFNGCCLLASEGL